MTGAAASDEKEAPGLDRQVVALLFTALAEDGEEVPLCPAQEHLKALVALAGGEGPGIHIVESRFPEVSGLGPLPAAFVGGRAASRPVLAQLLREHSSEASARELPAEQRAWADCAEAGLAAAAEAALWLHRPCLRRHTRPALARASSWAASPLLAWFVRRRVQRARAGVASAVEQTEAAAAGEHRALVREAVRRLGEVLIKLQSRLAAYGDRRGAGPALGAEELVVYSHAKVLLAIPPAVAPWDADLLGLDGLRRFVRAVEQDLVERRAAAAKVRRGSDWCFFGEEANAILDSLAKDDVVFGEAAPAAGGRGTGVAATAALAAWRGQPILPGQTRCNLMRRPEEPEEHDDAASGSAAEAFGEWRRKLWRSFFGAAPSGEPSPAAGGGSAEPEHERDHEPGGPAAAERRRQQLQRGNAMFMVWWTLSAGAFVVWHRRRHAALAGG